MLLKLNSFDDFLFENLDTTYFILSPSLFEVLEDIDNPISNKLKEDYGDNPKKKITYIDIILNDYAYWSFVNSVKINQYIEDKEGNIESVYLFNKYKDDILAKYKSKAKIGKIINKLYPNIYTAKELEEFVQLYKKHFSTTFDLLDIVKGNDIKKWYDCKNYNNPDDSTELTQSCMAATYKNEFMDFYAVNDDKVSMLILYSDDTKKKIDARAILWKPDIINNKKNTNGELFLDRIYFNRQEHKNIMEKYADVKGWYYRKNGIYNPHTKDIENVKFYLNNMKISPSHKMPYADTLDIFDPKTNTLTNDYQNCNNYGCLCSTQGNLNELTWFDKYNKFYHANDLVYAHDKGGHDYIPIEHTIYLPKYNNYYTKEYIDEEAKSNNKLVKVQDPIEVSEIGEKNAPYYEVFKQDTVKSKLDNKIYFGKDVKYSDFFDMYIPNNKAVWSTHMGTYLPIEDAIKVVINFDDYDYKYDYYLLDDPGEPIFKHKDGKYYINELKDKINKQKNEIN
jgi:hypothetical protein